MKKHKKNDSRVKNLKFKKAGDMPIAAISFGDMRYNKTGKWRSIKPEIDYGKCTSCMICWKYCPDASITIKDGKPFIDLDYCKGCGICIQECPIKAIDVKEEEK